MLCPMWKEKRKNEKTAGEEGVFADFCSFKVLTYGKATKCVRENIEIKLKMQKPLQIVS